MKEVNNNNNKHKLKNWFVVFYIHGRKFMIGSVFTYQRLSKDFLVNLSEFGCQFLRAQKQLLISKMPSITPCKDTLKGVLCQRRIMFCLQELLVECHFEGFSLKFEICSFCLLYIWCQLCLYSGTILGVVLYLLEERMMAIIIESRLDEQKLQFSKIRTMTFSVLDNYKGSSSKKIYVSNIFLCGIL